MMRIVILILAWFAVFGSAEASIPENPQFEFLEVGVNENGSTTWKVLGPDTDGNYGGQNGTGGFEAIVPRPELYCPIISDSVGNLHSVYDPHHASFMYYGSRLTGYGAVPGYRPLPVGQAGAELGSKYAYRNRAQQSIDLIWLGDNWYDPVTAQFLRPDALGNDASLNLYAVFRGNPYGYWDADGRLAKQAFTSATGMDLDSSIPFGEQLLEYRRGGQEHVAPYIDSWINMAISALSPDPRLNGMVIDEFGSPMMKSIGAYDPNSLSVQFAADVGPALQDLALAFAGAARPPAGANWQARTPGNPQYGALDSFGRPTGVRATITADMLGTGTRPSQNILPPGFGGEQMGHARGHLLGRQLGGSGSESRNLITMFQNPANHPTMSGFEAGIRSAVAGGQTVTYFAVPVYQGINSIPRGITISAQGSGGFSLDVSILNQGRR